MILQNKRDRESWYREKTIESLKDNTYLLENDIILVAETNCFYKVIKTTTDIPLQNNLFAEVMTSNIVGNSTSADKLKTPRTISLTGDVSGSTSFDGSINVSIDSTIANDSHTHSNSTITSLDASKITSGTIDIARLPQGALERCIVVSDDSARFKLTSSQVQQGDTVKVTSTNKMYFVVNISKLTTEEGYTVYTAGSATEVPWSGVTGKPGTFPPSTHTHTKEQITNFPTSMKNPFGLTIKLNGTSQDTYDGSIAKEINITPSGIGAQVEGNYADSDHVHTAGQVGAYTKVEVNSLLSGKANINHGNHVPATQSANNKVYLRNDNTWHTITPSDIGAQPAGNYANATHTHTAGAVGAYTKSEVDNKLSGKANSSHGNHVPAIQTANNKVFLRNDNTWATITPANIGAQPAGSYAAASHTHTATQVTQDATHRFVTDAEKTTWNNKANAHDHPYLSTSGGTITGNLTVDGTVNATQVYNAVWNDYAELFEKGEETEPGDIVCLDILSDKEQYIKADSSSKRVIGVHSDTYGHLIGGEKLDNFEDNFEKFIPIGLAGRVNVKVKGKVELGDYIVPSEEKGIGRAYNKDTDDRDLIIGYLVEADEREDVRRLKMFINKK